MIAFECPNCGNAISVDDDHAGRSAWCRKCRRVSTVPRKATAANANPAPASVPLGEPLTIVDPSQRGGAQWTLQLANPPADLKHIQPSAREKVRAEVGQAANEMDRMAQQRSDAVRLLQESASEISRLIGELAAAREENQSLREALDAHADANDKSGPSDSKKSAALRKQLTKLQHEVSAKDAEIDRLKNEWRAARDQIAKVVAGESDASGGTGRKELAEAMARDLDAAMTALVERDEEVIRLTRALEEAQQRGGSELQTVDAGEAHPDQTEEIAGLRDDYQRAREELENLERTLSEREAEFQAIQYEIATLRTAAEERDRLTNDQAEMSQTLVDSRRRLKDEENKRAALEQEIQALQTQLAEMDGELQRTRYQLAETTAEKDSDSAEPSMPAVERDELRQEVEAFKAQATAATQRAWALHEALQRAAAIAKDRDEKITALNAQVSDLQRMEQELADAQHQLDEFRAARETADALLAQRDETIALLQAEAGQWQSRLDEFSGQIQQLNFERDSARQQYEETARTADGERASLQTALAELESARATLAEQQQTLSAQLQELEASRAELAQFRANDAERTSEMDRMAARLAEASRQAEAAAYETDAERAKWQPLLAGHEETKAALDDAMAQLQTRDEHLREMQTRMAELETSLRENGSQLESLQNELELAKTTIHEREDRIDDLDFQVAGLSATLRDKETFTSAVEQECAALKARVEALVEELGQAQDAASEAQDRLKKADDELISLREISARLNAREKDLRTALDHRTTEVEKLLADISEFRSREKKLGEDIKARTDEIAALRAKVEENAAVHERADQLQRLLDENAREVAAAKETHAAELETIRAQLSAQAEEADQVRQNLEAARAEAAALSAEHETLKNHLADATGELERLRKESEALRDNAELYRQSSSEYEREVLELRAALEKSETENEALQLTANEAQRAAAQTDQELEAVRAELARQLTEKNPENDPNFQAAVELRIALAETTANRDDLQASLDAARESSNQTAAELAEARRRLEELEQTSNSLRSELDSVTRAASGSSNELDTLRADVQRLERELSDQQGRRDDETRTLTEQLEQAAAEISRSAKEIERLNMDLEDARKLADAAMAAENGARVHAFSVHEDLWKESPATNGDAESITPIVVNADEPDEQKVLVDALLRFLGRR